MMNKISSNDMKTKELANGLRIFYIPKKGFSKTFAMFTTDFGSVDSKFTLDGEEIVTPDGVAHFLEHKMFEDEDGNALQKFSETGASPNAFTSHTMTAYHFQCTDEFEKNLEILLKFVSTPYFTDENVEKEKGIIGQEIGMMDDDPFWQSYVTMYQSLYENHTIRASIAGSVESIAKIDKELLFKCHKAFYSPSNMVLVVCGDQNFDTIVKMAEEILPKESLEISSREYGQETEFAYKSLTEVQMAVSMPIFMLGYKDKPLAKGESKLRKEIIGEIASKCILGTSTPLYSALYNDRLINQNFEMEYTIFPEGAHLMAGGESRDPYQVREMIAKEFHRIKEQGIPQELFDRIKKSSYGMKIRSLDSPDDLCRLQTEAYFGGENYFNFIDIYNEINKSDIEKFLAQFADERKSAMAVIKNK